MKIKMKSLMAGPDGTRHPGEVVDVDAMEGKALVSAGYAEEVTAEAAAKPARGGKGAVPPTPTSKVPADQE